jgi:hypothetical protein
MIHITDFPKKEILRVAKNQMSHLVKKETFKTSYDKLISLSYDNETGITSLDNGEVFAKHPVSFESNMDLSIPFNVEWWTVHFARLVANEAYKIEKLAKK